MGTAVHPLTPGTRRGLLTYLFLHLLMIVSFLSSFHDSHSILEDEWGRPLTSSNHDIASRTPTSPLDLGNVTSGEHYAGMETLFAMSSAIHTTISSSTTPTISVLATTPAHAAINVQATPESATDSTSETESHNAPPPLQNLVPAQGARRPPLIDFLNSDTAYPNGDESQRTHREISAYPVVYSDTTNDALFRRLWEMERGPQVAMDQYIAEDLAFRRMRLMTHEARRSRALRFFPTLQPGSGESDGELLAQLTAVDSTLMGRLLATRFRPDVRPHFNTVQYLAMAFVALDRIATENQLYTWITNTFPYLATNLYSSPNGVAFFGWDMTLVLSSNANIADRLFEPIDPSTEIRHSFEAWDVLERLHFTAGHELEYPHALWRLPGGYEHHILENLYQIEPSIPPFWRRDAYDVPIPVYMVNRIPDEIWLRIFEAMFPYEDPLRVNVAAGGQPILEVRNRAWAAPGPRAPPGHPINRYAYSRLFMHVYDRLMQIRRLRGYAQQALFSRNYVILNQHWNNWHTAATFLYQLEYAGSLEFLTSFEVHLSSYHFQNLLRYLSRITNLNRVTFHVYLNSEFLLQWRQGVPSTPLVQALATFQRIGHLSLVFHPTNPQVHGYLYPLMTGNSRMEMR